MAKQDDYVRYTVRIPPDLYKRVQRHAGEESVNTQIVKALYQRFPPDPTPDEILEEIGAYIRWAGKARTTDLKIEGRRNLIEALKGLREIVEQQEEIRKKDEELAKNRKPDENEVLPGQNVPAPKLRKPKQAK